MQYDAIIVGGGPAGLSAAIKLKQLALINKQEVTVCILEKGAQIGAHIISGAVIDPRSLQELLPDIWHTAPFDTPATQDYFYGLSAKHAYRLPTPNLMKNRGNYLISLGELCKFLALHAEQLGCEIYTGFAAAEILYNECREVIGVSTGELGIDKFGNKTANYQPKVSLFAKITMFAEGCRGELSEQLLHKFNLRNSTQIQTYGLGLKEVWHTPKPLYSPGTVFHTIGWPLDRKTYGGSFIYYFSNNKIATGFVIGLDYKNPWLDPFYEFQRFKTHPFIKPMFKNAERISFGARALNEGGFQAIPKLTFPGGMLIGDAAGFLNVPKIKGIHTCIKSAIIASEACIQILFKKSTKVYEPTGYTQQIKQSWLYKELYKTRNIRPGFRYGVFYGVLNAFFEAYISHGKSFWTLKHAVDHKTLNLAKNSKKINYAKPDGVLTFDKLSSVYLSNTYHLENQPNHLKLLQPKLAIEYNYYQFASPEIRYCPAQVYEITDTGKDPILHINAQNCLHCKTCDIKDPKQNIMWTTPEGGGGPNYIGM